MNERREGTVTEPNISTLGSIFGGIWQHCDGGIRNSANLSVANHGMRGLRIFSRNVLGVLLDRQPTGDYEHAAFAVPTEAFAAARQAETAQVVIFGHSHSQVAFSAEPTRRYFSGRGASYYLLAFSGEFSSFYDFLCKGSA